LVAIVHCQGPAALDCFILGADVALCGMFGAVFQKLRSSGSAAGLSLQTLVALVTARCLHLFSHLLSLHYGPQVLPFTVYVLFDIINASLGVACIYIFCRFYYDSYEVEKDDFGIQLFDKFNCLPKAGPLRYRPIAAGSFLYLVVALVALAWYPVRWPTPNFTSGYFCCFYEMMSAIALIPQLWMFNKDKRVPPLLATFVVMVAVGRVLTLAFWWSYAYVYPWRTPANRGIQMTSEALNLLILSDFLYYWGKAVLLGQSHKEIILGSESYV